MQTFDITGPTSDWFYSLVPVTITGVDNAVAIDAGAQHLCVVRAAGTVSCLGGNLLRRVGRREHHRLGNPRRRGRSNKAATVAAASHTAAPWTTSGTVSCWGYNSLGDLGDGTTDDSPTPVSVVGLPTTSADQRRQRRDHLRAPHRRRRSMLGLQPIRPARQRHQDRLPHTGPRDRSALSWLRFGPVGADTGTCGDAWWD